MYANLTRSLVILERKFNKSLFICWNIIKTSLLGYCLRYCVMVRIFFSKITQLLLYQVDLPLIEMSQISYITKRIKLTYTKLTFSGWVTFI